MVHPALQEEPRSDVSGLHRIAPGTPIAGGPARRGSRGVVDSPRGLRRLAALFAVSVTAAAVGGYAAGRLSGRPGPRHEEHAVPRAGEAPDDGRAASAAAAEEPSIEPPRADPPAPPAAAPWRPPPAPRPAEEPAPFDLDAASFSLADLTRAVRACNPGPWGGVADVSVTFAPSGRVTRALVHGRPFAGTDAGSCMARELRDARVPPFDGAPVTVRKRFAMP